MRTLECEWRRLEASARADESASSASADPVGEAWPPGSDDGRGMQRGSRRRASRCFERSGGVRCRHCSGRGTPAGRPGGAQLGLASSPVEPRLPSDEHLIVAVFVGPEPATGTATSTNLARMFRALRNGTERFRVVAASPATTPRTTPSRWQVVAGLGDEALWNSRGLEVRSGDRLLGVAVEIHNVPDLSRSIAGGAAGAPTTVPRVSRSRFVRR